MQAEVHVTLWGISDGNLLEICDVFGCVISHDEIWLIEHSELYRSKESLPRCAGLVSYGMDFRELDGWHGRVELMRPLAMNL